MKKLAAQALAFQYQLQIENAQAVLNNNNAALNMVDQALHEVITANEIDSGTINAASCES
jgi:hypothetical protein